MKKKLKRPAKKQESRGRRCLNNVLKPIRGPIPDKDLKFCVPALPSLDLPVTLSPPPQPPQDEELPSDGIEVPVDRPSDSRSGLCV